jgi:hypothetical protein
MILRVIGFERSNHLKKRFVAVLSRHICTRMSSSAHVRPPHATAGTPRGVTSIRRDAECDRACVARLHVVGHAFAKLAIYPTASST